MQGHWPKARVLAFAKSDHGSFPNQACRAAESNRMQQLVTWLGTKVLALHQEKKEGEGGGEVEFQICAFVPLPKTITLKWLQVVGT